MTTRTLRSATAIATLLACASLLAGCGSSDGDDRPSRSEPAETVVEPEPDPEPIPGILEPPGDHDDSDRRPDDVPSSALAQRLPFRLGSVRLSADGVSDNGRRTRVRVQAEGRSRVELERLWGDLLMALGDDGRLLEPVYVSGREGGEK